MPYIVREGKSLIHGDSGGVHHRYLAGETVEGVEQGELDHCRAVQWISEKHAALLAEEDLHGKSNRELREMCEERGFDVTPRMAKDKLVALLQGDDQGHEGE